ncbi:hypothetical protein CMU95_11630 [Elizabethkingia anophelis]|nr:hypothetical protein [Elizabethkingia anophelis]
MATHLNTILELERHKNIRELAQILFMEGKIYSHYAGGENTSTMTYYNFVSRTIHMLNNDFNRALVSEIYDLNESEFDLSKPHPLLIEAYNMVGGKGNVLFPREDKYQIEGAMMRLMFTPGVYLSARMVCEAFEEKIGNKPLFMSGRTPMEIINNRSGYGVNTQGTNRSVNSSGCASVILLLIGIPIVFLWLFVF